MIAGIKIMGQKKIRKKISYAELTRILQVIYEKSYIKKTKWMVLEPWT